MAYIISRNLTSTALRITIVRSSESSESDSVTDLEADAVERLVIITYPTVCKAVDVDLTCTVVDIEVTVSVSCYD